MLRKGIRMTSLGLSSLVMGRFYCQEALMLPLRYCDHWAKLVLIEYISLGFLSHFRGIKIVPDLGFASNEGAS